MRTFALVVVLITVAVIRVAAVYGPKPVQTITTEAVVITETMRCVRCHTKKTPGIVQSWRNSSHAKAGVGCFECHAAKEGEPDAFEHFGEHVAVIVSPKDCAQCHQVEAEQFLASHHAKGGEVLGSLDNYLGEVVEGYGANVSGCRQCHGSKVEVMEDGSLHPATWPNFGIGRINPDGTSGSCSACHSRHDFSLAQARSPETCGRCHMGPDHPQKEVFEESKHGVAYRAHKDKLNMDKSTWVLGVDYSAAPTCATCHVSATPNQPRTHDIGQRISWNIRAPISKKTANSDQKRKAMQEVCANCHNPKYVKNFYSQFDAGIELYNGKFAEPAKEIIARLRKAEKIDNTPFNDEIEWIYFYLWHHEGRRARNGLAMMGPDYVQWHGFYEIAERFYFELIKEAEHLMPGVAKDILERPEHKWFSSKLSDDERKKINSYYDTKYGVTP